ncbi:MAG: glucuronate isomerase [Spirochaetales bacterium]|nr:glucuronate isomerase [Spirochaetales bacterium]
MKKFLHDNFLLESKPAERLYHDYANKMPIFDYHCHLPPEQIAENYRFENLSRIWLYGDHYKWRAMRTAGVDEKFITGDGSDIEKFRAWAGTVPATIGNPLYHWTHLELKTTFGITGKRLDSNTADEIYEKCGSLLNTEEFRARSIMKKFDVRAVCTTDDPADTLEHHTNIRKDMSFDIKVLPTFRPDKALAIDSGDEYLSYLSKLSVAAEIEIKDLSSLIEALDRRHLFFHEQGCRLSDHALTLPEFAESTKEGADKVLKKALGSENLSLNEAVVFRTYVLTELGRMNARRGWVMQLHLGALRNNNTRMFRKLGPDTGFDTITDGNTARPLARFLDGLDMTGELPRTIIYNLNPSDNDLLATMIGCFQDGSVAGKIQFGSGWWFNDQKDGMIRQMTSLANMGLLSKFVGMLTDSRSFLSYPRHEYFRRILSNLMGGWIEKGEAPEDYNLMGGMIMDICFNNAKEYFGIDLQG